MNFIESAVLSNWKELRLFQSDIEKLGYGKVTELQAGELLDNIVEQIDGKFNDMLKQALNNSGFVQQTRIKKDVTNESQ